MIPKTLYLYWGGRKLSWLRYLTVVSFAKHNPDWDIKVYYPKHPTPGGSWTTDEQIVSYEGEDWFERLSEYAELLPFEVEQMPEVHKSDIFRLWALYTFGGLYSDFDILYVKPVPKLTKRTFCRHPDGHYAIGFLAGRAGDKMLEVLLSAALKTSSNKYQGFGATLWEKTLAKQPSGWNIPKNLVYSCDWQDVESLFTEVKDLPDEAIGLHWYGGSITAGQWENRLTPESNYTSTIASITKEL